MGLPALLADVVVLPGTAVVGSVAVVVDDASVAGVDARMGIFSTATFFVTVALSSFDTKDDDKESVVVEVLVVLTPNIFALRPFHAFFGGGDTGGLDSKAKP